MGSVDPRRLFGLYLGAKSGKELVGIERMREGGSEEG